MSDEIRMSKLVVTLCDLQIILVLYFVFKNRKKYEDAEVEKISLSSVSFCFYFFPFFTPNTKIIPAKISKRGQMYCEMFLVHPIMVSM